MQGKRMPEGIRLRHARSCNRATCKCATYEAAVYSAAVGKKIRRTFSNLNEAKAWRHDAASAVRKHELRAPSAVTLCEAWTAWLADARAGMIRNRSGDVYKPSALRSYDQAMALHVLRDLGPLKLTEIRRTHVQALADRLLAQGLNPSTMRNALMPLRALYRRAIARDLVSVNPTTGLELAAVRGKRDRIASPAEAAGLLAALDEADRPLWATAFYAGLRRGELMGLRWEDVDFAAGRIHVQRAWDPKAKTYIEPKSKAGERHVPIPSLLREYLISHRLRSGRATGLVFGRDGETPFNYWTSNDRAARRWKRSGLERIGLHEARHTYASLMIAAGVNAKALSTYVGHASVTITLDRYGHLMPGNELEAATLLDAYLARTGAQTGAHLTKMA